MSNLLAKDKDKIILQLDWLNQFQFAGYYIAKEKGFYKDINLDVEIKEFNNKINLVNNVINNESTYSIGKSSLVIDKLNNKQIILLAAIYQQSPMNLISLKKSNISTIQDLKNKNVMLTPDAKDAVNINTMITSKNVKLKDINFKAHSFDLNDLITGKVDAMGCYLSNEPYILKNANIKFNVFNPSDYGFDFYGGILFTSNKELNTNPKRVKKFYQASIKGWNYAFANIEKTAQIIYQKYNTQNKTLDSLIYEGKILKKLAIKEKNQEIGLIDSKKIEEIKRLYLALGLSNHSNTKLDNFIFNHKKVILNTEESKFIKDNDFSLLTNTKNIPYSFNHNSNIKGIELDLLELISKKFDIDYNIIEKPKNIKIFNNIKTHTLDFYFNYSTKYINLEKTLYSKPILNIPMAMATTNNKNLIPNLSILKGEKLALLKGSDIYQKLKLNYPNLDLVFVQTKEEGFELLRTEEVFGFIDNILSLSHTIIKDDLRNIKISATLPYNLEIRLATNKENSVFIDIINKVIPLIKNEEKEEIIRKYQLILFKNVSDYTWVYKYVVPLLFTILIVLLVNNKMRKEIRKRRKAEKALQDFASRDSLTSIFNRGKIDFLIKEEILKTKNQEDTFAIIFFDIDDFKLINDDFGHIKGDEVLIEISKIISKNIRNTDVLGRWGGEEFIILLPKTTSNKAFILADSLRQLVSQYDFGIKRKITISLGITQYSKKDTRVDLIHRADKAMYLVKETGKNAVKTL